MRPALRVVSTGVRMTEAPAAPNHEVFMRLALDAARRGMLAGEPPVGACLVSAGEAVVTLGNAVIGDLDITAHAEMRVIREACRKMRTLDLAGCRLYVTVEPCLMCLSACHYAGIAEIIFGAGIDAMNALTGNEICAGPRGASGSVRLEGGCLDDECRALLVAWSENRAVGR